MPFRSDLPLYSAPYVRASLKELAVLPARIFTTMLMPPGVIGSAADAVEFLELSGQNGLARLAADMKVSPQLWRAPRVTDQAAGHAVCDGEGTSAFFYAGALADWLCAMLANSAKGVIAITGGAHSAYLAAVPYWLAQRGHAAAVVQLDAAGEVTATVSVVRNGAWTYDLVRGPQMPGDDAIDLEQVTQWSRIEPSAKPRHEIVRSVAVVVRKGPEGRPCGMRLTSADLAQKREQVLQHGWPVERELWERLMTFSDRSLIASSDQSRLGAGYAKDAVVE
jgi:hypothetical protein